MGKLVTIPEKVDTDIRLVGVTTDDKVAIIETNLKMEFVDWAVRCVDAYAELAKGRKAARQADKIVKIIEKANGSFALEQADFEVLDKAVDALGWGSSNRQLIPFYDALDAAEEIDIPQEKAKTAKAGDKTKPVVNDDTKKEK